MGTVRTGHGLHLAFRVIEQSKQNIEPHRYQSVISGMAKPVFFCAVQQNYARFFTYYTHFMKYVDRTRPGSDKLLSPRHINVEAIALQKTAPQLHGGRSNSLSLFWADTVSPLPRNDPYADVQLVRWSTLSTAAVVNTDFSCRGKELQVIALLHGIVLYFR